MVKSVHVHDLLEHWGLLHIPRPPLCTPLRRTTCMWSSTKSEGARGGGKRRTLFAKKYYQVTKTYFNETFGHIIGCAQELIAQSRF